MPTNAETNPDGIRYYEWQGVKYPSVTSLRRLLGMPFGLHNWMLANVMNAAIDNAAVLSMRKQAGETPLDMRRWLRTLADAQREAKADRGTRVHQAAHDKMPATSADDDVAPFLAQFYDWQQETGAVIEASEGQVFNLTLGYAGSFDLIATVDGRRHCIDIKTGDNLYPDHALQLIGYRLGEFVGENDVVAEGTTQLLRTCTDVTVLHLTQKAWDMVTLNVTKELVDTFKSMCVVAHWMDQHKTMDALIKEVRKS